MNITPPKIHNSREGWFKIGKEWHYFRHGMSLCWNHLFINHPQQGYQLDLEDKHSNCEMCNSVRYKEIDLINQQRIPNQWCKDLEQIQQAVELCPDIRLRHKATQLIRDMLHTHIDQQ